MIGDTLANFTMELYAYIWRLDNICTCTREYSVNAVVKGPKRLKGIFMLALPWINFLVPSAASTEDGEYYGKTGTVWQTGERGGERGKWLALVLEGECVVSRWGCFSHALSHQSCVFGEIQICILVAKADWRSVIPLHKLYDGKMWEVDTLESAYVQERGKEPTVRHTHT